MADRIQRQDQLARFGAGHPGPVVYAANAEIGDHKVVPALRDSRGGRWTPHSTTEDRIVPIHRVAVFLGERLRMRGKRVSQPAERQFPLRLRFPDQAGERKRTTDAVEHAGTSGQKRFENGPRFASSPTDFAVAHLQVDDEIDSFAHHRPHLRGE